MASIKGGTGGTKKAIYTPAQIARKNLDQLARQTVLVLASLLRLQAISEPTGIAVAPY